MSAFLSLLPILLLVGLFVFFMRQMQGGGKGGAMSFGKSKARLLDKDKNNITFQDVAGCDEAKEEVSEIVDYLINEPCITGYLCVFSAINDVLYAER